ncbi:hypothetical protein RMCBS344292_14819 [Rhizopus microsporus]|nr:hypothetical protein RMCBS344292_14819 [Rhizopus microsporus]
MRYRNCEIWSIDEAGILNVWDLTANEHPENPLITAMPRRHLVAPHATSCTIDGSRLWMSTGRTLSYYVISSSSQHEVSPSIRIPNDLGNITKLVTVPYHPGQLFASHDDGKISVWDTETMERKQVITVSLYGICTMACVGEYHIWTGYNTGMIYVYDTRPEKWAVVKMWKAHSGAVTQLVVDESGLIIDGKKGRLQVVSGDSNGYIGVWDGLLTEHWKECQILTRSNEYCTYDEAKIMICSWNIDANKPEKLTKEDNNEVRKWLGGMEDPDIIVVGIQEIVDLESKKQTARSLFFKKKVEEAEEVLTHRYKLWHDYLVRVIGENYGAHAYTVIKTEHMVGLFSCIFVRTVDIDRVINVESTCVKTGLKVMNKSIHGNKGGVAIRFVYDHSSLCFVNCHLAAGQSHVQQRNADAEGILQTATFQPRDYVDVFSHGGDGSLVLDHEFCFLSGDLNYRIKMNRNDVLRLLASTDKEAAWEKLQLEDQLLKQKMNNPLFKLLQFEEALIQFDPTYKYDPGTDFYDRSEKKRVPAWCDRKKDTSSFGTTDLPPTGFGGISNRRKSRKPIIAAVNGFALGGGMEMVVSCNIVVATEKSKFGLPEVKQGVVIAAGGLARLARSVSYQVASELVLTGRFMDAKEANKHGLVNEIVSNDTNIVDAALQWAKKITANSPDAVFLTKQGLLLSLELASVTDATDEWLQTPEAKAWREGYNLGEGLKAFSEKRKPQWKIPSKL